MKKRWVCVALAGAMAGSTLAMAGCGETKNENELWITFFKGGYGTEWATELAAKFEEENEGVTVRVDPDSQLIDAVPNMMENGTKYDLIFCHDVAWEDFVQPGEIYCLDELYATEVSDGVTFADRIWDETVLDSCTYLGPDGEEHYYKVPWTIGTAGIAYNVTVMDRIDAWFATTDGQSYLSTATGGEDTSRRWNKTPPATYYDLWQYCNDIVAAQLPVVEGDRDSGIVYPFTWSGPAEEWQWDYVVFDWWGQLAGPETVDTFKNLGNVTEDLKLDWSETDEPVMEVYDPDKYAVVRNADGTVNEAETTHIGFGEFKEAYRLWYNIVALNKTWSDEKVSSYSKFENEQAFASGYAAMTPAACWIENESKMYLERSGQTVSIMPTPVVSEVKLDANGEVIWPDETTQAAKTLDAIRATDASEHTVTVDDKTYDRVSFTSSFGDSVMIPEKATNKELAVKFILFMQEEENAQLFTKLSGGTILPYKYDYASSFVDENGVDQATLWQKAIFEIDQNSTKFNNYTQHPMIRQTTLRGSARMTTIWPKNNYYYAKAWADPASYAPDALMDTIYSGEGGITTMWATYLREM